MATLQEPAVLSWCCHNDSGHEASLIELITPQLSLQRHLHCRSREQAVATLQSPQFRRTLDVFSAALVSGRLDLRHFGLHPQVPPPLSGVSPTHSAALGLL